MQRLFPHSCGDSCYLIKNKLEHDIGVKAIRGRRKTMEDTHCIVRNITAGTDFIGIFDGHGGANVAESCAEIIPESVTEYLKNDKTMLANALIMALKDADTGLVESDTDTTLTGSTATTVLINPSYITICNLGDSAAFLLRGTTIIPMTCIHKPDHPEERHRIRRNGGIISCTPTDKTARVEGVLAVSRAIGDHSLRPFVSGEPDVREISCTQDNKILIVATDGLWDVMTPREAMTIAAHAIASNKAKATANAIASLLTKIAIEKHSRDNITVAVVLFA